MKTNTDLSDNEIETKVKKMNRRNFIIQTIIFGVLNLITFWGYLYIWSMGPFRDNIPNVNALIAATIHMMFAFSTALFGGSIIKYAVCRRPVFFQVSKYDLKYGKYSKRKGE